MSSTDMPDDSELKAPAFEMFVGVLSILAVINLVLLYFVADDNRRDVLYVMNGVLSVIFLGDFLYRLRTAGSKRRYLLNEMGWADLAASLPLPQVKVLRLFRVLRVIRLSRAYGFRNLLRTALRDRAGSALLTMVLMGILVLQFGSLWMLAIERNTPDANIQTASDAIWYVLVTMSTVGYGDQFPVSTAGRILGAMIIVVGVGIFGTFTGYLANLFLSAPDDDESADTTPTAATATSDEVRELRELLVRQQAVLEDLQRRTGTGSASTGAVS